MLAVICSLFVFLGMYIGNRYDLKKYSINSIFGLFVINGLCCILFNSYRVLYINYHRSTFLFLVLGCILGYALMKLISFKYEETDNISICGFTLFNTYLFVVSRFSFFFLLVNIFYYILIGIYISKSKSWIYVLLGLILGLVFSLFSSWVLGYMFTILFSFVLYFILSVYSLVFKSNGKMYNYSLICGIIVGLLGCVL